MNDSLVTSAVAQPLKVPWPMASMVRVGQSVSIGTQTILDNQVMINMKLHPWLAVVGESCSEGHGLTCAFGATAWDDNWRLWDVQICWDPKIDTLHNVELVSFADVFVGVCDRDIRRLEEARTRCSSPVEVGLSPSNSDKLSRSATRAGTGLSSLIPVDTSSRLFHCMLMIQHLDMQSNSQQIFHQLQQR